MGTIRMIAITLGLACAAVEFCVTVIGNKTPPHRAAHLAFGLVFLGLVYVVWMVK